jgi:predicted nucleic acid-binding protein
MKDEKNPLPVCRDPNDQKFLELARDCRADYLVTKDRALLELARRKIRRVPFCIVTPQQFGAALGNKGED